MTGAASRRTGGLPVALAQTAAGLAAHVAAAGCLPPGRVVALSVPSTVVAVLLLGRLLARHPLLRLTSGQLVVHAVLALSACAGGHAGHGHATPHLLMTAAHVAALVACRASLDAVAVSAERAAARVVAFVRPSWPAPVLLLPELAAPAVVPRTAARSRAHVHRRSPRRGPPQPLPA